MRIKILLIGPSQDKNFFMQGIDPKVGERNVYLANGVELQLMTTYEQIRPDLFSLKSLDSFHAVIHVQNQHDQKTQQVLGLIPKEMLFTYNVFENGTPASYLKYHLPSMENRLSYTYQEPTMPPHLFEKLSMIIGTMFAPPSPIAQTLKEGVNTETDDGSSPSHHAVSRPTAAF